MKSQRILVIEDETGWIELLKVWFSMAGYTEVLYTDNGQKGVDMANAHAPECILLDLVLPDMSGMEVCLKLRALPALARVPVILFTSHSREKVLGLQSGADYFVPKTEKPHELMATIEAALRRRQTEAGALVRGDLSLRMSDRQVLVGGSPIAQLSPKLFTLLHVLVERCPEPVSRQDLFRLVEGREDPGLSRALDVALNRLRKALPPAMASHIVNVKNFGYVWLDK